MSVQSASRHHGGFIADTAASSAIWADSDADRSVHDEAREYIVNLRALLADLFLVTEILEQRQKLARDVAT